MERRFVSYLLYELSKLYKKKNIGLYRDNRLAVFKNKSVPESEKIKKSIQSTFWEDELKITIQCNLKIVDYLDVTFNLTESSYCPFNKTNNEIMKPPMVDYMLQNSTNYFCLTSRVF